MFYYIDILIYQFQYGTNFPPFLTTPPQQHHVIHPPLQTAILPYLAEFLETNENLKLPGLASMAGAKKHPVWRMLKALW